MATTGALTGGLFRTRRATSINPPPDRQTPCDYTGRPDPAPLAQVFGTAAVADTDDLAPYGPWLLHPEDCSPLQPPPPVVNERDCRYCWPTFMSHSQAVHKHFLEMAERKLAKRNAQ